MYLIANWTESRLPVLEKALCLIAYGHILANTLHSAANYFTQQMMSSFLLANAQRCCSGSGLALAILLLGSLSVKIAPLSALFTVTHPFSHFFVLTQLLPKRFSYAKCLVFGTIGTHTFLRTPCTSLYLILMFLLNVAIFRFVLSRGPKNSGWLKFKCKSFIGQKRTRLM